MDVTFLSKTPLFAGCTVEETEQMLSCLTHTVRKYDKDQYIYYAGQVVTDVGIVVSGCVQVENVDVVGNTSILGIVESGDIFAESYACIPNQPMLVDVKACEDSEVLFINVPELFSKNATCGHGGKLIQNLLRVSSRKNHQIKIPFDRQQLADYLGVERTALSKELGKMRDEGLLTFHKNEFHISV